MFRKMKSSKTLLSLISMFFLSSCQPYEMNDFRFEIDQAEEEQQEEAKKGGYKITIEEWEEIGDTTTVVVYPDEQLIY